jgi:hypothetical protein
MGSSSILQGAGAGSLGKTATISVSESCYGPSGRQCHDLIQSNIHGKRSGRLRITSGRHLPSDCSGCLAWGAQPAAWSQAFALLLRVPARRRHCTVVPWATLFVARRSRVVGIDQATTGLGCPSPRCRLLLVACCRSPVASWVAATPLLQVLSSTKQLGVKLLHCYYACRLGDDTARWCPWATLLVARRSRVVGIDQATTGPGCPSSRCRQLPVACRQLGSSLRSPQAAVLPRPATPPLAGALEHYGGTTGSKLSLFGRERPCNGG